MHSLKKDRCGKAVDFVLNGTKHGLFDRACFVIFIVYTVESKYNFVYLLCFQFVLVAIVTYTVYFRFLENVFF